MSDGQLPRSGHRLWMKPATMLRQAVTSVTQWVRILTTEGTEKPRNFTIGKISIYFEPIVLLVFLIDYEYEHDHEKKVKPENRSLFLKLRFSPRHFLLGKRKMRGRVTQILNALNC